MVSLRQLERQMARDKEKHSGRLHELQAQYDDHTGQLQAKLQSTEAERNLLMVRVSSRIHLCCYHQQVIVFVCNPRSCIKGTRRGPQALEIHLNNFCCTCVLCWPQPTISPWTCRVMVPFIHKKETNEALLFLSGRATSHTSLGQTPTVYTGGEVLYSNISSIWFFSGRVLKKSNVCAMVGRIC